MADTSTERERQRRELHEALNDDPGGLTHPIWKELGQEPQPPISIEEEWLIDHASKLEGWEVGEYVIATKVWDRDKDGNWVKVWSIGDPVADPPLRPVTRNQAVSPQTVTPASYPIEEIARLNNLTGAQQGAIQVDPDATP